MSVTPEVLEPISKGDIDVTHADAEPLPRRRHVWRWITLAVVLILTAGATSFTVRASTKNVVGWTDGVVNGGGTGIVRHQDPFGAEPGTSWGEAQYRAGGTLRVGFSISNLSHTQTITVRSVTFDGVTHPGSPMESPISGATLSVNYDFRGGTWPMQAFHPFRLPPQAQAYIEWTLTMCPAGTPSNGANVDFSSYDIDYTYFGLHRHQTLPLVQPLQIDNVSYCD